MAQIFHIRIDYSLEYEGWDTKLLVSLPDEMTEEQGRALLNSLLTYLKKSYDWSHYLDSGFHKQVKESIDPKKIQGPAFFVVQNIIAVCNKAGKAKNKAISFNQTKIESDLMKVVEL
jgi:hypothetical protein